MNRAVIDTNVFIRALIKPLCTVAPIVIRIQDGKFSLIYTTWLLNELKEKLNEQRIRGKYNLSDQEIENLFKLINQHGEEVTPTRDINICRDVDDNKVIEAAVAGNANYVVTGDDDLLSLKQFENIRFVQPKEFLEIIDAKA